MNQYIEKNNVRYSELAFDKLVRLTLKKYEVEIVNDKIIDIVDNELIVNAVVMLANRVASITQTINIVKNEIQDSIFYFSAVTPKTIQIMLKGMEGKE